MGQNITPPATTSGIKVLDRAMLILVTIGEKPRSLTELCEATGLPRATAHRLASALETHHILTRTTDGRWTIGAVLTSLGARSATTLVDAATPIMAALMADTGESVQLYQLAGAHRVCIAAQEPASGLQNTVPTGSRLPLTAGSAAKIFLAYSSPALKATITHEWNHGLGEVVSALLRHGLELVALEEHDSIPWEALPGQMVLGEDGEWRLKSEPWRLPLSYTLQAVRR